MTPMSIELLTTAGITGGLVGGLAGALISWLWRTKYERSPQVAPEPEPVCQVDSDLGASIDHAATQWANEQGTPEAVDLIADKIRLGLVLQEHRRRGTRRWTR